MDDPEVATQRTARTHRREMRNRASLTARAIYRIAGVGLEPHDPGIMREASPEGEGSLPSEDAEQCGTEKNEKA